MEFQTSDRSKMEQILIQVERAVGPFSLDENLTPDDMVARFRKTGKKLTDKVTVDGKFCVDADLLAFHREDVGQPWNYHSADVTLLAKGKKLGRIQTEHGFVATGHSAYFRGRVRGGAKSVDATTEITVYSPNWQPNAKDMKLTQTNETSPDNGQVINQLNIYHTAKEKPSDVVRNLYDAINPKEKENFYEKLTKFKGNIHQKLGRGFAADKSTATARQDAHLDNGREF